MTSLRKWFVSISCSIAADRHGLNTSNLTTISFYTPPSGRDDSWLFPFHDLDPTRWTVPLAV